MRTLPREEVALSPALLPQLQTEEAIIQRWNTEMRFAVGGALDRIKTKSLWRATHRSWSDYLTDRWSWSRSWADRMIRAAATTKLVIDQAPVTERGALGAVLSNVDVVAELANAPPGRELELARAVLATAAGKSVTAEAVRTQVKRMTARSVDLVPAKKLPPLSETEVRTRAAEHAELMLGLKRAVTNLREAYEESSSQPWGRYLRSDNPGSLTSRTWNAFTELFDTIKFAAPYALCPCKGTDSQCPRCAGLGWISLLVFQNLLPSDRAKSTTLD